MRFFIHERKGFSIRGLKNSGLFQALVFREHLLLYAAPFVSFPVGRTICKGAWSANRRSEILFSQSGIPTMSIKDSSTLMKIIERSKLLQVSELEQAQALSVQHPDSQGFLKALYRRKMITRWQAGQLLAGNSSFFLGKYKLVELIGAGGMGRVFRAEHTAMNRSVALKIISRELVTDPDAQKLFLNEARAIAALNHPNIVHAYSVDKEGERYYIVMEYVEGADLEKIVQKDGPIDQTRTANFMLQAAGALHHAHERGMIHCDIKPANLLINETDQVKILDMGLARFHSKSDSKGKRSAETHDETGNDGEAVPQVIGTVDYMAPEVAEEHANASPLSDIYSLGCVMYFLLTGQIPFPGDTIPERILKHQCGEPKDPRELQPELSPKLCAVCLKMMAREPAERFQNGQEIMDALSEWLSESQHDDADGSSLSLDFSHLVSAGDSHSSKIGASKKSGFFGRSSKLKKGTDAGSETAEGSRIGKESSLSKMAAEEHSDANAAQKSEPQKDIPDFGMLGELIAANDPANSSAKEEIELPDFLGGLAGNAASEKAASEKAASENLAIFGKSEKSVDPETEKEAETLEKVPSSRQTEEVPAPSGKDDAEKFSSDPDDLLNFENAEKGEVSDDTVIASDEELAEAAASVQGPSSVDGCVPEKSDPIEILQCELQKNGKAEDELDVPETFSLAAFEPSETHLKFSAEDEKDAKDKKDAKDEEDVKDEKDAIKNALENDAEALVRPVLKKPRHAWKNEEETTASAAPKKVSKVRTSAKKKASSNPGIPAAVTVGLAKVRGFGAYIKTVWNKLAPKQKLLYSGIGGGALLLLLIVLLLIFCLSGGDDPSKNTPVSENESTEVVEEVSETNDGSAMESGEAGSGEAGSGEAGSGEAESGEAESGEKDGVQQETVGDANADAENAASPEVAADTETETADTSKDVAEAAVGNDAEEPVNEEGEEGKAEKAENADEPSDAKETEAASENEETVENAGSDAEAEDAETQRAAEEEAEAKKKAEEEAKAKEEEEARRKEAAEPFKNSPFAVTLPEPDGEKMELTQITHAGMDVSVSLLGGDTAFPVRSSGKKPGTQTKFFALSEADGDVPTWEIRYRMREEEHLAAVLTLEGNTLQFKWEASEKIPPKDLPVLGNCALKLTCNEKEHVLALRQAVELETLVLGGKTGGATLKSGKLDIPFPSLEMVYVEIVRVGKIPEDSKILQLPEPMKATEISKRNPLTVNFKFEDANGNAQDPLVFQFVPTFSNNFAGTLTPVLSIPGGSLMAQIEMAKNPQMEIQVSDWKKQISAIEKKNEGVAVHARSPQDTAKAAQLELQIWFVDVLKQLDGADFEYRVYADLDGNQIDLVTSRYVSPDEKKASKKSSRSSKGRRAQNDSGDSGDAEQEDGGFGGFEGMSF